MAMKTKTPKELIEASIAHRTWRDQEWRKAWRFLVGDQWLRNRRFTSGNAFPSNIDNKRRVSINLILPIYRYVVSTLALDYPGVVVMPASVSSEDMAKAKASEVILRYVWNASETLEAMSEAIRHMVAFGTGAIHSYFSKSMNGICRESIDTTDLFFEGGAKKEKQSRFIAIRHWWSKEEAMEKYPEHEELIEHASTPMESSYDGFTYADDMVAVFEFYWRNGRHQVAIDDKVVFETDRAMGGVYPFRYTDIPGLIWGIGLVEGLCDSQWLYNFTRSRQAENVSMMGNPKWMVPKTAGISAEALKGGAGEIVHHNPGSAPQQQKPAELPQYVMDHIARSMAEMQDVAGVHGASLGKRQVGVTAGKAIDSLEENSDQQLNMTRLNIECAVKKMFKRDLEIIREMYPDEMMINMFDAAGTPLMNTIRRTDVSERPDVFVEVGSMFQDGQVAREARLMARAQAGMITPQDAAKEIDARQGGVKGIERVVGVAHANDVLEALLIVDPLTGEAPTVEIFKTDNLEAFELVFHEFMMTPAFYELSPERQAYIAEVYNSIISFGMPDQEFQKNQALNKVWPRAAVDPQAQAGNEAALMSPEAQAQTAEEQYKIRAMTRLANEGAMRNSDANRGASVGPLG